MEKCPRAFCVAYSVICHNPCDVLSSVWHRGNNLLVWVIDTLLEVLTGTSEAPGIARRTECAVYVSVWEHMCIFLHRDHCLTRKVNRGDLIPAELSEE